MCNIEGIEILTTEGFIQYKSHQKVTGHVSTMLKAPKLSKVCCMRKEKPQNKMVTNFVLIEDIVNVTVLFV